MEFDLFKKEDEIIRNAQALLERAEIPKDAQDHFRALLKDFQKLSKDSRRLVKHSDRNEIKLRDANSEILRQKEELERTQQELVQAEKMASLGRLVSGVAHELNTPLGIILTSASFLRGESENLQQLLAAGKVKKSDLTAFVEAALESSHLMQAHSQRASELITSFKAVSVDQTRDEIRTIELSAFIKDVVRSLAPSLASKHVVINQEGLAEVEITTHAGPFAQVMTNLILNAYKHGFDEGERAGEITLKLRPEPTQVILEVSDDGKGVAPDIKDKIFDPFVTSARDTGGTGLGLHIVHNIIVSKLQGRVELVDQPQGCGFMITLPRALKEEPHHDDTI